MIQAWRTQIMATEHLKDDMTSALSRVPEEISGRFAFGRSHQKFREANLAAMHQMQKIAAVAIRDPLILWCTV
jgi:glutamine amidotransferase PdxT